MLCGDETALNNGLTALLSRSLDPGGSAANNVFEKAPNLSLREILNKLVAKQRFDMCRDAALILMKGRSSFRLTRSCRDHAAAGCLHILITKLSDRNCLPLLLGEFGRIGALVNETQKPLRFNFAVSDKMFFRPAKGRFEHRAVLLLVVNWAFANLEIVLNQPHTYIDLRDKLKYYSKAEAS